MNMTKRVRRIAGTVTSVALAITAVFALLGPGKQSFELFVTNLAAQEAQKQVSSVKDYLRRQEDRDLTKECATKGKTEARCERESNYRWAVLWNYEDCITGGGDEKECGKQPAPALPPDE